jgi:chromosome segregation ATPase
MDKHLMDELEQYRATAALNTAGVNLHKENKELRELVERQKGYLAENTEDIKFYKEHWKSQVEINEKHKERNKKLSTKLSTATTERDKLKKEVKGYESILLNLKKYLDSEKEMSEFTHVPHLLDYIKDLERVARK